MWTHSWPHAEAARQVRHRALPCLAEGPCRVEASLACGRDDPLNVDPRQLERAVRRDARAVSYRSRGSDFTVKESLELELTLRTQALDTTKGAGAARKAAIAILADFYEEHGQLSRAVLWRAQLDPHGARREVPDLLTRPHRPQAADCRRNQMIWLLRKQGASVRKVATAFALSATRVEQIVALEDRRIGMHAMHEQLRPTLKATERLVAIGALSGDRPTRHGHQERWFDLDVDEPPQDWPAEHKRRGK